MNKDVDRIEFHWISEYEDCYVAKDVDADPYLGDIVSAFVRFLRSVGYVDESINKYLAVERLPENMLIEDEEDL